MNKNQPTSGNVKWIVTPAIPIMKQVGPWLKATGKPMPKTFEEWLRAARLFIDHTAPFN